jgi:hypothetical protein
MRPSSKASQTSIFSFVGDTSCVQTVSGKQRGSRQRILHAGSLVVQTRKYDYHYPYTPMPTHLARLGQLNTEF